MQSIYHITLKKKRKGEQDPEHEVTEFFFIVVNNIFSYIKYSNAISNIVIANNKEKIGCTFCMNVKCCYV